MASAHCSGVLGLDDHGFVRTGLDAVYRTRDEDAPSRMATGAAGNNRARRLAAGDVRSGSAELLFALP
ncbi:hypothetical protein [Nocardia vinacea]|uniref:hypothetical protein n=1 Tax=Nocardia vinacea TaxID=96468 RepID=UPI00030ECCC4|nr:hypothetical protein [Nocardia vinacea]